METCKAKIQEGPRKGESCTFPPGDSNAYCGRHQRNYEYDTLVNSEKRLCRFFFRGCNSLLEASEKSPSCKLCREKLTKKTKDCSHKDCKFKTDGSKYCKKHERDTYYDEEKEKGIKYCDVARGCFTICKEGLKSCEACLKHDQTIENTRRKNRNEISTQLQMQNTIHQICVGCGKDFDKFMTRYNRPSKICKHCNESNTKQDAKRPDRDRNFKNENYNNIPRYFKEYVVGASKRGYSMDLQYDDFKDLVLTSCYYCKSQIEGEVNGIDRVDNSKGYSKENCVACCQVCNRIKLIYHPAFFITKCKIISKTISTPEDFFSKWKEHYGRTTKQNYKTFVYSSEIRRNLKVNISEDEWNILIHKSCHYCGYTHINGIGLDRLDNSIREYTLSNVVPCCGSCNLMKGEMPYQEFLDKTKMVAEAWPDISGFGTIAIPKDPFKEAGRKVETQAPTVETRKSWKALGVYYSVLSGERGVYETQKDILTEQEFLSLADTVKHHTKEHCVPEIQKLLVKLKKRRQRAS
jgi:hypothetical protein